MVVPETEAQQALQREDGRTIHRRETWQQIILPFMGGVAVLAAVFGIAAMMRDPLAMQRVSVIADCMFSALMLCPMVICMFPLYLLMVVAIYGLNKLHQGTESPLQRLENLTETIMQRVDGFTQNVNQRVVNANVRLAPLMHWLSFFNTQEDNRAEQSSTDS